MEVRLNKYLKDKGLASRRKADEFIEKGYIKVNGKVVTEMGFRVDEDKDKIEISEMAEEEKKNYRYILLNKPFGYVASKSENEGKSVFSLLPEVKGLTYAGRLDKESKGLLIFSNDGEFIYGITSPEFEKEKEYSVSVDALVTEAALDKMRKGMLIDGKRTREAVVTKTGDRSYNIVLNEGINRQIRKMAKRVEYNVIELIRIRIKDITLNDKELRPGKWRDLTKEEVESLKKRD